MGRRKKTRNQTRVFVVQDKSGSMSFRRAETISGFNEYKETLTKDAEGEVLLSLVQFDTQVNSPFTNRKLSEVSDLTPEDYVPGGMTALYDGVGRTIKDAESSIGDDDKVLVVIMTDGAENSSREYDHEAILKRIEDKRKDGWEFVFLGAGEEAWDAGHALGIPNTHTINYGAIDANDHKTGYEVLAAATTNLTRGGNASFDSSAKSRLESKAKAELKK